MTVRALTRSALLCSLLASGLCACADRSDSMSEPARARGSSPDRRPAPPSPAVSKPVPELPALIVDAGAAAQQRCTRAQDCVIAIPDGSCCSCKRTAYNREFFEELEAHRQAICAAADCGRCPNRRLVRRRASCRDGRCTVLEIKRSPLGQDPLPPLEL